MSDSVKALEAERSRLHVLRLDVIIDLEEGREFGSLRIRDCREAADNFAFIMHGHRPGSWNRFSVAQSQATFT